MILQTCDGSEGCDPGKNSFFDNHIILFVYAAFIKYSFSQQIHPESGVVAI